MDLALAHSVAQALAAKGTKLDAGQMLAAHLCVPQCEGRTVHAPEAVQSDTGYRSLVPSRGSKLIGGSIKHGTHARGR
jgi:hypothetical protein